MKEERASAPKRLFFSIELPGYLKDCLEGLREDIGGVSWVLPEQRHLTLRFLGDVEEETEAILREKVAGLRVKPFTLPVEGVGVFPGRGKPFSLWVGMGGAHPHLFQLQQNLENLLVGMGFDMEKRRYHPHITLARCGRASPADLSLFLKKHREFEGPPFRVDSYTLFSSVLASQGARHTREMVIPFE